MRSETRAIHRNSGAAIPSDILPDLKSAEVGIDRIFGFGVGLVILDWDSREQACSERTLAVAFSGRLNRFTGDLTLF